MTETSYEFTRAITRLPARSIVNGLRAEDIGDPDYEQMLRDCKTETAAKYFVERLEQLAR